MASKILKQIEKLPSEPGVYQFKDAAGAMLYIGKAKSLKKRVSSYFNKKHEDVKTGELVKKIHDVEVITTTNEVEALILEASLIKKNQPPFNIDLKAGSGRYAYLKITDEQFPRIVTARLASRRPRRTRNDQDKTDGKIFGPYTSGQTRREAQYLANTTFKLRTCNKLPKQACLLYHIGLCSAPCIKKISEQEYDDNVKKAAQFLKGDVAQLVKKLEHEMKDFSGKLKYEQAKVRRDQIAAINRIGEKQSIDLPKGYDQDVMNYVSANDTTLVYVFNVQKGLVGAKKEFALAPEPSPSGRWEAGQFSAFIRRYYDSHDIPDEVIIPQRLPDADIVRRYLSSVRGKKVVLTVPRQGSKKALLDLLKQNLDMDARTGSAVLYELRQGLNLPALPRIIEMFDVSHTGGTEIVAGMVRFVDGRADKSGYRKFKMKTVKDNDDFASMREVVGRRYRGLLRDTKQLPDLIIVDGGRGQLSAALGVLRELGIAVPLIALAKKREEVYTTGRRFPVRLSKQSESLKLLQRIRDEAHRFAITFHRQRRAKKLLK